MPFVAVPMWVRSPLLPFFLRRCRERTGSISVVHFHVHSRVKEFFSFPVAVSWDRVLYLPERARRFSFSETDRAG
jgi:hypothetical protein